MDFIIKCSYCLDYIINSNYKYFFYKKTRFYNLFYL